MNIRRPYILTINAGSSSIKFALYTVGSNQKPAAVFSGAVSSIGWPSAQLAITEIASGKKTEKPIHASDCVAAVKVVMSWLNEHVPTEELLAVGHRIVHGGPYYQDPQLITDTTVATLQKVIKFDPIHMPDELALVAAFTKEYPGVAQIACFDTSFHKDLPRAAQLLPIPRKYDTKGIRRYGFHGLSCAYIIDELETIAGPEAANGRVLIAHLGNGVSLTAVKNRQSVDTTMALTPAAGVPMSTRSGDLDPGIVRYLADTEGQTAAEFDTMVTAQSGLLGMSETTADMKLLLEQEEKDERAKEAVAVFCYGIKKSIGALAAALGGIDTLVFTGGMGENAPKIRARVCEGLEFLGISVDPVKNGRMAEVISPEGGGVTVRVMPTDESLTIARQSLQLMERGDYEANK
ncbi:MAG TPA: acetate/propionate family kinase [Verrucomicrobiae bacterium]|nr:acetate/propionate family kinase [Verrucomicrobiae bacterium]